MESKDLLLALRSFDCAALRARFAQDDSFCKDRAKQTKNTVSPDMGGTVFFGYGSRIDPHFTNAAADVSVIEGIDTDRGDPYAQIQMIAG